MDKVFNHENWREGWGNSVDISKEEIRKFSSKEILEKIKLFTNYYSPVWIAMLAVLEERKEPEVGRELIEFLRTCTGESDFTKREHLVQSIFKIFNIDNLILSTLITGPSNDFSINYFKLGIRRLLEIIG